MVSEMFGVTLPPAICGRGQKEEDVEKYSKIRRKKRARRKSVENRRGMWHLMEQEMRGKEEWKKAKML